MHETLAQTSGGTPVPFLFPMYLTHFMSPHPVAIHLHLILPANDVA